MKKLLGILLLGLLLSGCSDIYQEIIYQTRYINRALHPQETINLMGRKCVCYDNIMPSGIYNNLIEFEDDKLGWIKYYFQFGRGSDYATIGKLKGWGVTTRAVGYLKIYKGYKHIQTRIWQMDGAGLIIINRDKKNTMRFHLKSEVYKDNKLFVKIKNADYPEGKFFKINLISKNSFYRLIE
jgi:hypothetical protein